MKAWKHEAEYHECWPETIYPVSPPQTQEDFDLWKENTSDIKTTGPHLADSDFKIVHWLIWKLTVCTSGKGKS